MSRVAKSPVTLPSGVEVALNGQSVAIKGGKGSLELNVHTSVEVKKEENVLTFAPRDGAKQSRALAGFANKTVIFCVPGSTNACKTAWQKILLNYIKLHKLLTLTNNYFLKT